MHIHLVCRILLMSIYMISSCDHKMWTLRQINVDEKGHSSRKMSSLSPSGSPLHSSPPYLLRRLTCIWTTSKDSLADLAFGWVQPMVIAAGNWKKEVRRGGCICSLGSLPVSCWQPASSLELSLSLKPLCSFPCPTSVWTLHYPCSFSVPSIFIYKLLIKLCSNYPIWVCCQFPAANVTDTHYS